MVEVDKVKFPIKALVDSGCAKTAISTKLYEKLIKVSNIPIKESKVKIQTCDGTTHQIKGLAEITFTIRFAKSN